ncbi:hypothetical protein DUNSADRAFT_7417 [Dunaliella salina]|uniref:Uncharacterized protein n=1 Tax=Dunaliella salina TaxID=3046 RepID=A0ABQ7GLE2_DUNSA|nr:hypothetical protein DUNSADRAFT_7417 [Dunaliella salina]|eukprot:KAF5835429.1 hypothetical protein DUNSADRAFT_7417 [Dunaliella salina]
MSMASLCGSGGTARTSQCMAYLGAIVTLLFACDGEGAWRCYQEAMAVSVFACSEEGTAAQMLMDAYRSEDDQVVRKAVASCQTLKFLDNKVARLAMRLPQGTTKQVAASLGEAAGGGYAGTLAGGGGKGGDPGGPYFKGNVLDYGTKGGGGGAADTRAAQEEEEELL